ncbi:thioredoxin family protein [Kaistella palustris]|uniref:thioredoxin family protein n=1 Tax=Kaistella palustris TaxID=493376 RepID=UPI0003FD206B|nr:thioredoxin family protein [Kaistella palustris]
MAQKNSGQINWISFTQLNDSLAVRPRKVFVNFYADWCVYCTEMERTTFRDPQIVRILNRDFYAVKMNVESEEEITFGEQTYINNRKKKLNPVHEIALLLASRKNRPFSLPAFVLFNENFQAEARYFQFLDEKALLKILTK